MKIGDLVRTKNYGIRKILDIGEYLGIKQYLINEDGTYIIDNSIIKSSPNIIDLIEVGDYVNREKVLFITKNGNTRLEVVCSDGKNMLGWRNYKEKEFKSIVTKEQFKSMEYEVK